MRALLILIILLLLCGLGAVGYLAFEQSSRQAEPTQSAMDFTQTPSTQEPAFKSGDPQAMPGRPENNTGVTQADFDKLREAAKGRRSDLEAPSLRKGDRLDAPSAKSKGRRVSPVERAYKSAIKAARRGMTLSQATSALQKLGARRLDSRRRNGIRMTRFALKVKGLYVMVSTKAGRVVYCSPATRSS